MVTRTEISAAYWRAITQMPRAITARSPRHADARRKQRIDSWLQSCETELEDTFDGSAIMRDDPHDNFKKVNHHG